MKKVVTLFMCFWLVSTYMSAQDCMALFPGNEGAVLITKTYDGNSKLLNTMTYRVDKTYNYGNGSDMQIGFMMTDNYNNVIDRGSMDASCVDGNFYLRMANRAMSPDVTEMLGKNTELLGSFLDYPDTFNENNPFSGAFQMEAGDYIIQSKTNKNDKLHVRVYDRVYEKNEKMTTPAGTFNTTRVNFRFDCTKDGVTKTHKGIEWYAPGAGIVRSETYDGNDNLENYTELYALQDR